MSAALSWLGLLARRLVIRINGFSHLSLAGSRHEAAEQTAAQLVWLDFTYRPVGQWALIDALLPLNYWVIERLRALGRLRFGLRHARLGCWARTSTHTVPSSQLIP